MYTDSNSSNKKVVKNTIFLYSRMILLLGVSLLTTKVMLEALGVEDYGLNNVVAGIVTFFTFLNFTLTTATLRYLTYEIGAGNKDELRKIFSNSLITHAILALFVIIAGESIGLYVVNYILNIPSNRLFACNIAFQLVILQSVFTLIETPFRALIISYERMDLYAYLGFFDAIAKLLICYLVKISIFDKLISLSVLQGTITISVTCIYIFYCHKYLRDSFTMSLHIDRKLAKSMIKFTIWNLIGSVASLLRNQGVNILINIFFGPIVNAANAIAYRINSAVTGFTSNFTMALNPQITKNYASRNHEQIKKLLISGGKFTFFLMMILSYPLMFEINTVLSLWLGDNVPKYTSIMAVLVLMLSLVETFNYTIGNAIQATGQVKYYQIVISGILLLNFPIAYLLYKFEYPPYTALCVSIFLAFIGLTVRLHFIDKQLKIAPSEYASRVFSRTFGVAVLAIIPPSVLVLFVAETITRLLTTCIVTVIINTTLLWFIGLEAYEKKFIINLINKKRHHIK